MFYQCVECVKVITLDLESFIENLQNQFEYNSDIRSKENLILIVKGDILWAFQGMKKPFSLKNIDLDVRKVGGECQSQSSNVLTVLFFYN